jgi:hypothetical protein
MTAEALATYRPSPIKRDRRTRADMDVIRQAIYDVLEADNPMTVRGVFYQLVSRGVVEKAEADYKGTVGRLLVQMREAGMIPFGWIADNTRWMRKPRTYSSMEAALRRTAETYRRSLWDDSDVYVEVWCEKDALAGVLVEETGLYDVGLMVARGFSSISFLYSSAEYIKAIGKPAFIYYFGDHDPSGLGISRNVEQRLREWAPGCEIHFERVAVTPEQIVSMGLPTRPTKTTDTRSKSFVGESVDLDAIPARYLRALVSTCIVSHLDINEVGRIEIIEEAERETLANMVKNLKRRKR